jgi:hypothetical protein
MHRVRLLPIAVFRAWLFGKIRLIAISSFLFALAVICFVVGWGYRPPAGELPQLPSAPQLVINFNRAPPPLSLLIDSKLIQTSSSQTELEVNATGTFRPKQTVVSWIMTVQGLTGYICTQTPYQGSVEDLGSQDYAIKKTLQIPSGGDSFLIVHLCWHGNAPLTVKDSYFSANLPCILDLNQAGTLTRSLQLTGTSLSAYTLAEAITPTSVTPGVWSWESPLSSAPGNQASTAMPVFGSSILGIQRDSNNTFVAGILFGIAGGAFISVLPLLPDIFERRDAKHETTANGDSRRRATRSPERLFRPLRIDE